MLDKAIDGDESTFKASHGWLWRWQKRHGISQHKVVGEKRSADTAGAAEFPAKLLEFINEQQLSPEQIYNADETGLYYRMLPDRTLAQKEDTRKSEGYKLVKDRTTLLWCTNKSAEHKLTPLCIGKYASPRCFHRVNMNAMPLAYTASGNAWMTASIFKEWFHKTFVPAVRRHLRERWLEEKAVLLLDNCRAHLPANLLRSADGKITVMHLPPNTTSVIQPLHQGIISSFKRHYRRELVNLMLLSDDSVIKFLKWFYLKDMFLLAGKALAMVTAQTIEHCWMEGLAPAFPEFAHPPTDDDDDDEFEGFTADEINAAETKLSDHLSGDTLGAFIDEWSTIGEHCAITKKLAEQEIIATATQATATDDDVDDIPAEPARPVPSATETVAALEVALQWIVTQDTDYVTVMHVSDVLNLAKKQQRDSCKQKKMTAFFTRTKYF